MINQDWWFTTLLTADEDYKNYFRGAFPTSCR